MNFEPRVILAPTFGNNADARTVCVRLMNDTEPTTAQLAELAKQFEHHKTAVRLSIAGFLTRDGALRDGSAFRITSNSGLDIVMLWPAMAGRPPVLAKTIVRLFCIPADTTHQYGWIAPPVTGSNGTTATVSTRATAGAIAKLKKDPEATTPTFNFGSLARYQDVLLPALKNVDFASNGFSAQNWEHREWVSPDFKTVVSSLEVIRVNEVSYGVGPGGNDALFTCVYPYTAPGEDSPAPYLFTVTTAVNSTVLTFSRRALSLSSTWATAATLDVTTLDASAVVNPVATDKTMRYWIKKVTVNKSRTICSLWLQHPSAEGQAHNGTKWVGIVDVDMSTGAITSTRAVAEVTRYTEGAHSGLAYTYSQILTTTGSRQISFDYDGDTKVYTTLEFSGTLQINYSRTSGSSGSYSYSYTVTDTREVSIKRGTFEQRIGWADYTGANSHEEHMTFSGSTLTSSSYSQLTDVTQHVGIVDYYGGHHGDLLMVKDSAVHNKNHAVGGTTVAGGNYIVFGWQHTTTPGDVASRKIYADGALLLDNGSGTFQTEVVATEDTGFFPTGTTSSAGVDTNPGLAQAWGGASNIPTDIWNGAGYFPDPISGSQALFHLGTRGLNGHPAYVAVDSAGAIADPSAMNARAVADSFFILSVPKIGTDGKPSTSQFQSYCTDPDVVTAFNVNASTGILKGLRLK